MTRTTDRGASAPELVGSILQSWGAYLILLLLGLPSLASATTYTIDAQFSDGGTLTGYFDINAGGYLGDFNLQTSANGPFAGFDFVPPTMANGYVAGTASGSEVTFFGPSYGGDQLALFTETPLISGVASPLLSTSFECQNSYSCPTSGDVRYVVVPEPVSWATMIAGLAGVGARLRTRKRKALT